MKRKTESTPLTSEAKHVIAMAAEELGGVERMVKWAKSSSHNLGVFYSQIYIKLLPFTVAGQINATVESEESIRAELERTLLNLLASRGEDEAAGVVIDVTPDPEPSVVDHVTYTRSTAPADVQNVVRLNAPDRPATAAPPPPETRVASTPPKDLTPEEARARAMAPNPQAPQQQSSTAAYYEWSGNSKPYWGPVGGGGGPP